MMHVVTSLGPWCHASHRVTAMAKTGKSKGAGHTCVGWYVHTHGGWECVSSTQAPDMPRQACAKQCQELPSNAKNCQELPRTSRVIPRKAVPTHAKECPEVQRNAEERPRQGHVHVSARSCKAKDRARNHQMRSRDDIRPGCAKTCHSPI